MVIGKLSMSFHLNRILQHRYYNHSMSYKSNKDFRNLYIILHPSSSYLTHIQYNRLRNCKQCKGMGTLNKWFPLSSSCWIRMFYIHQCYCKFGKVKHKVSTRSHQGRSCQIHMSSMWQWSRSMFCMEKSMGYSWFHRSNSYLIHKSCIRFMIYKLHMGIHISYITLLQDNEYQLHKQYSLLQMYKWNMVMSKLCIRLHPNSRYHLNTFYSQSMMSKYHMGIRKPRIKFLTDNKNLKHNSSTLQKNYYMSSKVVYIECMIHLPRCGSPHS